MIWQRILVLMLTMGMAGCGWDFDFDDDDDGPSAGRTDVLALTQDAGEASAEDCPHGGVLLNVGVDENGNATLDEDEVDSQEVLCDGGDGTNGVQGPSGDIGENGDNGRDAAELLLTVATEPPGDNCEFGGSAITYGLDQNGDEVLDPDEVVDSTFICDEEDHSADYIGDLQVYDEVTIDAFCADFERIYGDIFVTGEAVTTLSGLSCLRAVTGNVVINGTAVETLSGLNNLRSIGGDLVVERNESLLDITALDGLVALGGNYRFDVGGTTAAETICSEQLPEVISEWSTHFTAEGTCGSRGEGGLGPVSDSGSSSNPDAAPDGGEIPQDMDGDGIPDSEEGSEGTENAGS